MTPEPGADALLNALRSSVGRLREIASGLSETELTKPAYPADWSIAQVLSHLGSAAVIMQRRVDDTLAAAMTPDDFAPGVWDVWNAKTPAQQRDDGLAADAALVDRIEAMTAEERERLALAMGPLTLSFAQFVAMRLNEHVLHTWDIEVALDPAATLPQQAAELVIDNLDLIARFTGKPTGDASTITVATVDPKRAFTIDLTPDAVSFSAATDADSPDVEMPAETFIRLVYGRLDSDHTPEAISGDSVDTLRRVFPGP